MFRSFLDHHQVHKELKYATCNKIILVRNETLLSLHCTLYRNLRPPRIRQNNRKIQLKYMKKRCYLL